ncbi:MAG: hypothetical protein BGO97_08335 [Micrococcales bacterium 70-64]|nr:hypothetical protein [Leifsonia sp.]ODU64035.1 MAG: hypothetical protein ABT06_08340 [Leifsonia sp. SCN 70-46]OJX85726.1 MAG: hypothetical protein BGO97_08335 [Micrococcales bacterium 70-64]
MSDDARFDPRFDPAFQPGYEGPLTPTRPARSKAAAAPQALPVVERAATETVVVDETAVHEDADERPPRRLNPFLVALGASAVILLGVGLYLVSRLRDLFADTQSTSSFDYVTLQVLMFAAPLLLVLGLATGIGVLFLFAVRWDRSRS